MNTGIDGNSFIRASEEDDYFVLSLKDLLRVLWRRLWLVVLTALLCGGLVAGYYLMQTPSYAAYAKVLVGQQTKTGAPPSSLGNQVQGLQDITITAAEALKSRSVAQAVIKEEGLNMSAEELLANLSADPIPDTQFMLVTYENSDPATAQQVVNAVGDEFAKKVSAISPGATGITATVWERADQASPVGPKPVRNGLLGGLLGAMLGIGLVFLLENLDDRLRSPQEVERASGVPTLATIPFAERSTKSKVK